MRIQLDLVLQRAEPVLARRTEVETGFEPV